MLNERKRWGLRTTRRRLPEVVAGLVAGLVALAFGSPVLALFVSATVTMLAHLLVDYLRAPAEITEARARARDVEAARRDRELRDTEAARSQAVADIANRERYR